MSRKRRWQGPEDPGWRPGPAADAAGELGRLDEPNLLLIGPSVYPATSPTAEPGVPAAGGTGEAGDPGRGGAARVVEPARSEGEVLPGDEDLPPPVDPAPLGWFLLSLAYALTAVYSAVPAAGSTLFGAAPEGAGRMAAALVVVPYLLAGLYTGLTHGGRSWVYPATFAAWPLLFERLALYLFGVAGQWMLAGFPDGWRQALPLGTALAFTRETLAPYATPAYLVAGTASLALTVVVFYATRLVADRLVAARTANNARSGGSRGGAPAGPRVPPGSRRRVAGSRRLDDGGRGLRP